MNLSGYIQGRDNNFNIIRIIAALSVLVTHSFALALGTGNAEPFRNSLGMTIGDIAVDIFFLTSGFLVTASLMIRQNIVEFIWARFLRIFPGLLIMLILTVFVMGVLITSIPATSYLTNLDVYIYFAKAVTLISGVNFSLPGVFTDNPYKNTVNGSLWTMPWEIRMYIILAMVWYVLKVIPTVRLKLFKIIIVTLACVGGIYLLAAQIFSLSSAVTFSRLFFMFFAGATCYILKERIVLLRWIFWFLFVCLFFAALNKYLFFIIYILVIAYILFYIAYVPSGYIRKYNQLGDYSYGVYIYAFPVQQSVAALVPGVSVTMMIIISTSVTIPLAVLSWHLLEKRCLDLKGRYVEHTKRLLSLESIKN